MQNLTSNMTAKFQNEKIMRKEKLMGYNLKASHLVEAILCSFPHVRYALYLSNNSKKRMTNIITLHYQGELDNQPKNHLNQGKTHIAHQQLFLPQR